MKPFGVMADSHNFNWHAFATTNGDGVNNRLVHILDEMERCAQAVAEVGGGIVYHAGDLFHVRGSVAPSVYTPTRDRMLDCHRRYGIEWAILPGNHDMEHKYSNRIGNSIEMMVDADAISVEHEPAWFDGNGTNAPTLMLPWVDNMAEFKRLVEDHARARDVKEYHLFIHAPVDGVIKGIPEHGLSAAYLASLGFASVWAGHYHNAKAMPGNVFSVGALTHQTWSDVGATAGFWIVNDEGATHHPSKAPKFIDLDLSQPKEVQSQCPGNYVRAKLKSPKTAELKAAQELFKKLGAAGVRIDVVKEPSRVRESGAIVKTGATIEQAITDFVAAAKMPDEVARESVRVLAEAA